MESSQKKSFLFGLIESRYSDVLLQFSKDAELPYGLCVAALARRAQEVESADFTEESATLLLIAVASLYHDHRSLQSWLRGECEMAIPDWEDYLDNITMELRPMPVFTRRPAGDRDAMAMERRGHRSA